VAYTTCICPLSGSLTQTQIQKIAFQNPSFANDADGLKDVQCDGNKITAQTLDLKPHRAFNADRELQQNNPEVQSRLFDRFSKKESICGGFRRWQKNALFCHLLVETKQTSITNEQT
jgi:hypothetical protein